MDIVFGVAVGLIYGQLAKRGLLPYAGLRHCGPASELPGWSYAAQWWGKPRWKRFREANRSSNRGTMR